MKETHMHSLLRRRALSLGGVMAGAACPMRAGAGTWWRRELVPQLGAAGGPWGERARSAGALGPAAGLSLVTDVQLLKRARRLVYLSALLVPGALTAQDTASQIGTAVRRNPSGAVLVTYPALARGVRPGLLRRRCAGGDAAACTCPAAMSRVHKGLGAQRYGRVARVDIEALLDRAVSIETQRAMQSALPRRELVRMTTGHRPFLPQPQHLAAERVGLA